MVRGIAAVRTLVRLSFACGITAGCLPCHAQLCGTMHPMQSNQGWSGGAYGLSADGAIAAGNVSHYGLRAVRWDAEGNLFDMSPVTGISQANSVSGDGSAIVGSSDVSVGYTWDSRPFRWTQETGLLHLDVPYGIGHATSHDGSRIVGYSYTGGYQRAFVWHEQGGTTAIGTLGGLNAAALGISADGIVVVGQADNAAGQTRAFRWTESDGMVDIGTLGGTDARAYAVSDDGSVIVGTSEDANGKWRAFRWESGLMSAIGPDNSAANDLSSDGSVIVGVVYSHNPGHIQGFRWTETSGWIDMGSLGGSMTSPLAMSADGHVVVGVSKDSAGQDRPFRWIGAPTLADYNGDLYLEVVDFLDFFDDFGACDQESAPCGTFGNPDINGDTIIDVLDFLDYMDAFGRGC